MQGVHDNVSAFIKKWKEKLRKIFELDWSKVCWREVENSNSLKIKLKKVKGELKACIRYFLSNFYFSPNDSHSKTIKNVFYFI